MATISIQLGPETRSKTISAAHLIRFVEAYRAIYGQISDGQGGMRDRTDAEVATAIAEGLFNGWKAAVLSHEKEVAAAAAAATQTELTLS
jgi:hypothetical protein